MAPVNPEEAERLQRLAHLRDQVFECDRELVRQMAHRTALIREIEEIKTELGFPLSDPERDAAVVRRAEGLAQDHAGAELSLVRDIMWRIVANGSGRPSTENGGAPAESLEETRPSSGQTQSGG